MTRTMRLFRSTLQVVLTVLLVGMASGQARAQGVESWALEAHSGHVRLVKSGVMPIALTTGDVFAGGDWIETGPDGRAVLRRGAETIVVAPNSRIGLPRENGGPLATRILQTLGTILLTVEKQAAQHFEVVTPYLTAVVKGTTFTVGIQGTRASVHVVEGLVQVTNLASGRSSLIRPGQTGAVFSGGSDAGVRIEGGLAKGATPVQNGAEAAAPASAAPASNDAAPVATDPAPAATPASAARVTITQTLGPDSLDLAESTDGLVRAASRAAPHAAVGNIAATEGAGKSSLAGARAMGGETIALSAPAPVSATLSTAVAPSSSALAPAPLSATLSTAISPLSAPLAPAPAPAVTLATSPAKLVSLPSLIAPLEDGQGQDTQ